MLRPTWEVVKGDKCVFNLLSEDSRNEEVYTNILFVLMNYLIDISKASVAPPQSAVWSWNIHVLNNLALAVNVCVNRDLQQTTHNWQSRVEALLVLDMQRNTRFMNKSQRPLFIIFGMVASALFCVLLSLWNLFMETWKKTNKYLFSYIKKNRAISVFSIFQQIINTWIMYRFYQR